MAQLALYLDDETAERVDRAAREKGMSRSAWVRAVIRARLDDRLPDSFFATFGSWADERGPDDILADLRAGDEQTERQDIE